MEYVWINGVRVDNVSMKSATKRIIDLAVSSGKHQVSTPNMDFIYNATKDSSFKELLNQCSLNVPDGKPLIYLSKLIGEELQEKVSGADLFVNICKEVSNTGLKIYLLGSAPGVAEKATQNLTEKYKGLNIVGTNSPSFGFEKDQEESKLIVEEINKLAPDILFVGLGSPKQEYWIAKNLNDLNVKVAIGVGASFDFASGVKQIPPPIIKKIGFAWFWRLLLEPKRLWRRYLLNNLPLFLKLFFLSLLSKLKRSKV